MPNNCGPNGWPPKYFSVGGKWVLLVLPVEASSVKFYLVLPSTAQYFQVLPSIDIAKYCLVLPSIVLPVSNNYYKALPGISQLVISGCHLFLPVKANVAQHCLLLPTIAQYYLALPSIARYYSVGYKWLLPGLMQ